MSVISRLQRLTGEADNETGAEEGAKSRSGEISRLRKRIDAVLSRRPEGPAAKTTSTVRGRGCPLEDLVPGEERVNEAGKFFCACHLAGGSARHGRFCIRDLAPLDMGRLALLGNDPALCGLDYHKALFLDTETTGLAGGTGTVAFLIGLGWFEGDAFVTRQLFARDYAEERATLIHLQEMLHERQFLVSFNGKAFDANLLTSRFIMNRLQNPLNGLPHLDLLHPARRLLRHRLNDRRLGSLEAALLGFEREGDIPGSEIPQRYFDWLRQRDGLLMADVFEHNRLDILSLAALAAHLAEMIDPDRDAALCHSGDLLAAARLFVARNHCQDAIRLLIPLTGSACVETSREAGRQLSLLYKREEQWPAAVALWEEMVGRDGQDLFALQELAKWFEHRQHDFSRALSLTVRACSHAARLTQEDSASLDRRRERLEKKLASAR